MASETQAGPCLSGPQLPLSACLGGLAISCSPEAEL